MFANDTANNPASVQYGGQNMTGLTHSTNGAQGARIFYLINPPTGTQSLTYTLSGAHRACISTYNIAADTSAAYDSVENGATGTSTGPSASVTPNNQPNLIVTCCAHEGANAMTGAGTGQTALVDADGFFDEGTWNTAFSYEATTSTSANSQSFTNGASDTWTLRTAVFKEVASANVNVTPGSATLTLTPQTPTVATTSNVNVAPGATTLTLTRNAPTVTASDHKNVVPGGTTLTLTPFTPTVEVGSPSVNVTPGAASLTLTRFTPTVTATANQSVAPGAASLTLTAFAPTVTATANVNVTPGPATLTLTTFAATVTGDQVAEVVSSGPTPAGSRRRYILPDGRHVIATRRDIEEILERFVTTEIKSQKKKQKKQAKVLEAVGLIEIEPQIIEVKLPSRYVFKPDPKTYEEAIKAIQRRMDDEEAILLLI
jgi:hypothetical protein